MIQTGLQEEKTFTQTCRHLSLHDSYFGFSSIRVSKRFCVQVLLNVWKLHRSYPKLMLMLKLILLHTLHVLSKFVSFLVETLSAI